MERKRFAYNKEKRTWAQVASGEANEEMSSSLSQISPQIRDIESGNAGLNNEGHEQRRIQSTGIDSLEIPDLSSLNLRDESSDFRIIFKDELAFENERKRTNVAVNEPRNFFGNQAKRINSELPSQSQMFNNIFSNLGDANVAAGAQAGQYQTSLPTQTRTRLHLNYGIQESERTAETMGLTFNFGLQNESTNASQVRGQPSVGVMVSSAQNQSSSISQIQNVFSASDPANKLQRSTSLNDYREHKSQQQRALFTFGQPQRASSVQDQQHSTFGTTHQFAVNNQGFQPNIGHIEQADLRPEQRPSLLGYYSPDQMISQGHFNFGLQGPSLLGLPPNSFAYQGPQAAFGIFGQGTASGNFGLAQIPTNNYPQFSNLQQQPSGGQYVQGNPNVGYLFPHPNFGLANLPQNFQNYAGGQMVGSFGQAFQNQTSMTANLPKQQQVGVPATPTHGHNFGKFILEQNFKNFADGEDFACFHLEKVFGRDHLARMMAEYSISHIFGTYLLDLMVKRAQLEEEYTAYFGRNQLCLGQNSEENEEVQKFMGYLRWLKINYEPNILEQKPSGWGPQTSQNSGIGSSRMFFMTPQEEQIWSGGNQDPVPETRHTLEFYGQIVKQYAPLLKYYNEGQQQLIVRLLASANMTPMEIFRKKMAELENEDNNETVAPARRENVLRNQLINHFAAGQSASAMGLGTIARRDLQDKGDDVNVFVNPWNN